MIEPPSESRPLGAFASLRHRDFAVFWSSGLLSNIGTWMQYLTVPYVLDQLTHSTTVVGVGAFATFVPTVLIGPLGGSLADRCSRRTVLLWSQGVMMLAAVALWILWVSSTATTASVIVCVAVAACGNGVVIGAWFAFLPQLVPRDHMMNAIRVNALAFQGSRALGPALAGLVLATLGPASAFLINALSFVAVLIGLFSIPARPVGDRGSDLGVWSHFRDGVGYVRGRQVLAVATSSVAILALFGQSMVQLVEPFSRRVLHVGPGRYGVLVAAFGVGGVVGSAIALRAARVRRSRMLFASASGFVGAELALAVAPGFEFATAAMAGLGVAWILCNLPLQTSIQANVHESHRGRVMSIYLMAFSAGVPIGALLGGVAGDAFGLRATFAAAATALGVFLAVAGLKLDRFQLIDASIDDLDPARGAPSRLRPVRPGALDEV